MRRSLPILLVAAVLATSCARTASPEATKSGVRGIVLSGPSCPVETMDSPCPDRPWEGTVTATAQDGSVAGETQTDQDGRFTLPLPPGTYTLTPQVEEAGPPSAAPQEVTVNEDEFTDVRLSVDSGIR
jgi:hypothetical protein